MLLLDEAIQQLKENEEQIREENSRILKEAEDKQQEGKEVENWISDDIFGGWKI